MNIQQSIVNKESAKYPHNRNVYKIVIFSIIGFKGQFHEINHKNMDFYNEPWLQFNQTDGKMFFSN